MEYAGIIGAIKTDICVVLEDSAYQVHRERIWSDGAEEFLRKIHKQGLHLTIIGPRMPYRLGSKKNVRFLDRHDVVGIKELEITKKQKIELRVLSRKSKTWFRIRTEACLVIGSSGVYPYKFDGWTSGGMLTADAYLKWVYENKTLPADRIAFLGSQNQQIRNAIQALRMNAQRVFIIEQEESAKCFRSYEELFESMGGRIFRKHQVIRFENDPELGLKKIYLKNEKGTMIMEVGALVIGQANEEHINSPQFWKKGLFYIQRRIHPLDLNSDEEIWFDIYDWEELYYRIARKFNFIDPKTIENSLFHLKQLKKNAFSYRKNRSFYEYSGKILSRTTLSQIQVSPSTPRNLNQENPVASLECNENIPCRACADACPENAIEIKALIDQPKLIENLCTGCGKCVAVCPTSSAFMIQENKNQGKMKYFLPDTFSNKISVGSQVQLLNRKGEYLGMGKTVDVQTYEKSLNQIITIEASDVFVWDARRFNIPAQPIEPYAPDKYDRYSWIQLNGTKRMTPQDIPVSIALWKLGHQRFEDAMLCSNGNCGLCEIEVNGKKEFACQIKVTEGMNIVLPETNKTNQIKNPICVCRQIEAKELMSPTLEGVSQKCMIEKTGVGSGSCHGRWCLHSIEMAVQSDKLRPNFHGYEQSPWRDVLLKDIFEERKDSEKK